MRIGIVGLGAIGGTVAARLLATRAAGEELQLAAGSEKAAALLRSRGLAVVEGEAGEGLLPIGCDAQAALPGGAPYSLVLLCVRSEATAGALDAVLPLLAADGAVVCLQNGLPEEAVAARAGAARTLGAVIGWSATQDEPGRYRVTGRGGFELGALGSPAPPSLARAQALLARAFPTSRIDDLQSARWGKLALNCAISTLGAVSGLSFGGLARRRDARVLALRCIGEVVAVARAKGVRPAPVSGLRAQWLADDGRRPSPILRPLRHALFRLAASQRPRQRSGMLGRLLAGRTSGQIDDLNGAVVAQAAALGMEAPLNRALLDLVHAIERGEERIAPEQLERLVAR